MSGGSTTKAAELARPGQGPKGARAPEEPAGKSRLNDVSAGNIATNKPALDLREDPTGVVLRVRAKPRASRSAVVGVTEGGLDVAVAAPPVDGAANEELLRALAEHFGIPRRRVTLVAGEGSRHKRVHLAGLGAADVLAMALPRR